MEQKSKFISNKDYMVNSLSADIEDFVKGGRTYFLSVGDTDISATTDARLTIQFISLPAFHLEGRRILVFL